jgi:hypothetical protein
MATRLASEIVKGDVILGRRAGPLTVREDAQESIVRGGLGYRIKLEGYPTIRMQGDPELQIADDPDKAWDEHVMIRSRL